MGTDWDKLLDCDLNNATENFTGALMTTTRYSIPQKTISTKSNHKPWFSLERKRQIRKRDRLFFIAQRRDTPHDWERWRRQRNITTETNQRLRNTHIQEQVSKRLEQKRDPRAFHNTLNKMSHWKKSKPKHPSTH